MPEADNFQLSRNDEVDFRYYRNLGTARKEITEENLLNYYQLYFEALMMNFSTHKNHYVHNEKISYIFAIKTRLYVLLPKSDRYSI